MRLPGFTAQASLYRSTRTYGNRPRPAAGDATRLVPQDNYACSGGHCGCHGVDDCLDCLTEGSCYVPCEIFGDTMICEQGTRRR
jgi:hypothetical protein